MNVLLPTPGTPLMPTRAARPVCGQQQLEQPLRRLLVIGARALDQRDRLGERAPVAGAHVGGERSTAGAGARVDRLPRASGAERAAHRVRLAAARAARGSSISVEHPPRRLRDLRARAEDRLHARLLEERRSPCGGMMPPTVTTMSLGAELLRAP